MLNHTSLVQLNPNRDISKKHSNICRSVQYCVWTNQEQHSSRNQWRIDSDDMAVLHLFRHRLITDCFPNADPGSFLRSEFFTLLESVKSQCRWSYKKEKYTIDGQHAVQLTVKIQSYAFILLLYCNETPTARGTFDMFIPLLGHKRGLGSTDYCTR